MVSWCRVYRRITCHRCRMPPQRHHPPHRRLPCSHSNQCRIIRCCQQLLQRPLLPPTNRRHRRRLRPAVTQIKSIIRPLATIPWTVIRCHRQWATIIVAVATKITTPIWSYQIIRYRAVLVIAAAAIAVERAVSMRRRHYQSTWVRPWHKSTADNNRCRRHR